MSATLRIARGLVARIEADLKRPHAFAYERVGFVFARWAECGDEVVVLPFEYLPIEDERYIEDRGVGAKIDSSAIRAALQSTLTTGAACLHVHMHPKGLSHFGGLDLDEQARLIPSFAATVSGAPHGALLLHEDGAAARVWSGSQLVDVDRVVEVGYPMRTTRRRY